MKDFNPETGRPANSLRYRLTDNYARFYLRYIEPVTRMVDCGHLAPTVEAQGDFNAVIDIRDVLF